MCGSMVDIQSAAAGIRGTLAPPGEYD